ncbi:MAG: hypothetical protein KatS3mg115_1441 [Candidatus Poribacteria bacterium]|nr:MAG: hypothetical protein KatS3mg115_1441 [Candidatus Poribacteria bacterium]
MERDLRSSQTVGPKEDLRPPRVSVRAILLGLIYVFFVALITPYNDYYIRNTFLIGNHFPIGPFFLFSVTILLCNGLLWRWRPGWALRPAELMTLWVMMTVASTVPSSGYLRYHLFMLTAPHYFATPENDWENLLLPYLPDWLIVTDPYAVRTFYEGVGRDGVIPWRVWIRPILIWSGYAGLIWFSLFCLAAILRKQWSERERFQFPLVKLPVEMVEAPKPGRAWNRFFHDPRMWAGFAVPVVIHTLGGLHAHFPSVPHLPMYFYPDRYLTARPWYALRSVVIFIYPSVVGFTYLLSLDVSLSFWLFYVLYKVQSVLLVVFGSNVSGWTLANRQEMGAYLALVAYVLWLARPHLKTVFLAAIGRRQVSDQNEPLPYSAAFWGLTLGTLAMALFWHLAGMSFWLALSLHLLFYIMCIVLSWMVTDGGFLFLLAIFRPSDYLIIPLGTARFSNRDLVLLAYEKTFMFDLREFVMPHYLNGFKAAESVGVSPRRWGVPTALALAISLLGAYIGGLWVWYTKGGLNLAYWYAPEPFDRAARQILSQTRTNWQEVGFIGIGASVMTFLIAMRMRFIWWRIHPLGYAMTTSWAPYTVWFSFFLGWLFKGLILKAGGFRSYRAFRPFFLGVVVGEAIMAGIWVIVGLFTGVAYRIMPG